MRTHRTPKAEGHLPAQILFNNGPEEDPQRAGEMRLAVEAVEVLLRHYPGHPWWVQVPPGQGVLVVKHPMLSSLYGMVVHISALNGDPGMRRVVMAGGEILERWNQRAGGMIPEDIVQAMPVFNDKKLIGRR